MNNSAEKTRNVNITGRLVVNNLTLPVGQICGDSLLLPDGVDPPSGDAELIVSVNGQENVYQIFIPPGVEQKSGFLSFW